MPDTLSGGFDFPPHVAAQLRSYRVPHVAYAQIPLFIFKPDTEMTSIMRLIQAWEAWDIPVLQQDQWMYDLGVTTEFRMKHTVISYFRKLEYIPKEWEGRSIEYLYAHITAQVKRRNDR